MLPRATHTRSPRGDSSRSKEISRLIGRTLRQAVSLPALRGHVITVDCDVLQADGGTRTAAITGGYVALALAIRRLAAAGRVPLAALGEPVAAVSVGLLAGQARLDLDYEEDHRAEVDLNVAMTAAGGLIEVQGTAEHHPFDRAQLDAMLDLAAAGVVRLVIAQRAALAEVAP
jgi:ribonuclease PH